MNLWKAHKENKLQELKKLRKEVRWRINYHREKVQDAMLQEDSYDVYIKQIEDRLKEEKNV